VPVSQRENQTQRGPLATDRRGRNVQDSPAFFSYTNTTKVRSFRVQFDLNLTLSPPMRVILNLRDTQFASQGSTEIWNSWTCGYFWCVFTN